MKRSLWVAMLFVAIVSFNATIAFSAAVKETQRFPQYENEKVQVWRTVIMPKQPLKMHRHDNARIVVPLTDVKLKVVYENDVHPPKYHEWKKGNAYYLDKDPPNEMHADINESSHPMEVMVIQFK